MTCNLVLIMLGLMMADEPAVGTSAARPARTRLRPLDATAASLLAEAPLRSPTIARLLEAIESSDLIAQIEVPRYLSPSSGGVTRLITVADGWRYVRVSLSWQKSHAETLILLGHELQHAVEIARAPGVETQKQMLDLYKRIGFPLSGRKQFDTVAAMETTRTVRREVYNPERTRMAQRAAEKKRIES